MRKIIMILTLLILSVGCTSRLLQKGDYVKVVDPYSKYYGQVYKVWSDDLLPDRWNLKVYVFVERKSESGTTLFYISQLAKCDSTGGAK